MSMKLLLDALKLTGDQFPEAFTVADLLAEDNALVYVNSNFLESTGYGVDDCVGKNCRFLQGPTTNKETVSLMRNAILERKACYFNLVNYRKNGERFWNRLLLLPVGINEDDIRYYVGIQSDVTDKYSDFEQPVPYQLLEKTDLELKNKIQDVVNYHRSIKYLDIIEGDPEFSEKFKEFTTNAKEKIKSICDYLYSL